MASDRLTALRALLADTADEMVNPSILQPAEVFLDLAGEDIRRRLFMTTSAFGEDLCLRPDFTIPVCLAHRATGRSEPVTYGYLGPVFRQRRSGSAEFLQAGVEWIGHADTAATDAAALSRALQAAAALGLTQPRIRVGDATLFSALVEALPLSPAWRRRLIAWFGEPERLSGALAKLAGGQGLAGTTGPTGLSRALAGVEPEEAHRIVADMLGAAGLSLAGGRTADEIADRLRDTGTLSAGDTEAQAAAGVLERYLAIKTPLLEAERTVQAFAETEGVDMSEALAGFRARVSAFEAAGVPLADTAFAADFGRRLDYYTGLVFELYDPARPDTAQTIGGGRYDKLLSLLGAPQPVPAIGFSVWLDRFGIETGIGGAA
ncbi:ATP phosphoribosyltransferase regulatory subunit [Amorphus orientalis]|uniref:ATP phosphoribosyltransferase regulatory subunit n=1 Tax=Amorphus orientalis TaxID=649198 RepID=A0AAE3VP53_9HYPH|nr:ATP phosphoribosyltransferase regulatory subunit [Amorphus orientalis]MDQ0315231.1 ATP phosphoribosyltransferase regulatory subunit [Amorphus orientalis]